MRELLRETADLAADYLESVPDRPVFPRIEPDQLRDRLGGALPEGPTPPRDVVRDLAAAGSEGAIGISGGRYFGFVIGGGGAPPPAPPPLTPPLGPNAG